MSQIDEHTSGQHALVFDVSAPPEDLGVTEENVREWIGGERLPVHRVPPVTSDPDSEDGRMYALRADVRSLADNEQLDPPPEQDDDLRRVYAIELVGCELTDHNGDRCVYVGQSVRSPRARFIQHLVGYRAARHVRKWGTRLRVDLYRDVPVSVSSEESEQREREKASQLADRGFDVHGVELDT